MYVCTVIFLSIFCPWQQYEGWIRDIRSDTVPLDRIKLCICGHARVGKSAMRESLSAPFLRVTYWQYSGTSDKGPFDKGTSDKGPSEMGRPLYKGHLFQSNANT